MNFSEIKLPSNRKFGFFFGFVFALVAAYFFWTKNIFWANSFSAGSLILVVITLVKADYLLPMNRLWMRFGLLLGTVVSPIVLGIMFYGLFTPVAIVMRLSGRDELRLKFNRKQSHWITRAEPITPESFKHQF